MEKILNGINVDQFNSTLDQLKANPELARFQFRAISEWQGGALSRTKIRDFHGAGKECAHAREFTMEVDEPAELLGTDKAPNPVEALLHALANCISTTFVFRAASQGVKIDSLSVRLEGDIDLRGFAGLANVRPGLPSIRYYYRVKSSASEEQIRELWQWAQAHSPVADTVMHTVNVTVQADTRPARAETAA